MIEKNPSLVIIEKILNIKLLEAYLIFTLKFIWS